MPLQTTAGKISSLPERNRRCGPSDGPTGQAPPRLSSHVGGFSASPKSQHAGKRIHREKTRMTHVPADHFHALMASAGHDGQGIRTVGATSRRTAGPETVASVTGRVETYPGASRLDRDRNRRARHRTLQHRALTVDASMRPRSIDRGNSHPLSYSIFKDLGAHLRTPPDSLPCRSAVHPIPSI